MSRYVVMAMIVVASLAANAQVVEQITRYDSDRIHNYDIDGSGSLLVASATADLTGTNPSHSWQIFGWTFPGGTPAQLTALPEGVMREVSISDDGSTIAFRSPADPLGTNPDHSPELFLMTSAGVITIQLTDDVELPLSFVLSGSGNRVVFDSYADPLGSNPANARHLFAIDADGTNLVQVTSAEPPDGPGGFDVSNNGSLVVYDAVVGDIIQQDKVFLIGANGTNLTELAFGSVPRIAGNGSRVVYTTDPFGDGEIRVVPRNGGDPTVLGIGNDPTITDDGRYVYYSFRDNDPLQSRELFEVDVLSPVPTQLTFTTNPVFNLYPLVSGDGSRIVYTVTGGPIPPAVNPDGGAELATLDLSGPTTEQLTENAYTGLEWEPGVSAEGGRIVFKSRADYTAENPGAIDQVFLVEPDTGQITQLTSDWAESPVISGDGQLVAYLSATDPLGTNPGNDMQLFTVGHDGSGLTQVTTDSAYKWLPGLASDGSFALFESLGDFTGGNPDGSVELFKVSLLDSTITQLSTDIDQWWPNHRLSADDQWVVYNSRTNYDGLNPNGTQQVFLARTDGTSDVRITAHPNSGAWRPTLSGDGGVIVYVSDADPLGTNADNSWEVFLYDVAGAQTEQLTATTATGFYAATITPDGQFVYFFSSEPFTGTPGYGLYRLTVSSGVVRRASGLRDPRGGFGVGNPSDTLPSLVVDANGRAVLTARINMGGENDDVDYQVWRVDFDAIAGVRPGKSSPTVVVWDAEPEPYSYDVIRGNVATLTAGAGTTDLGPVVCVENDSLNNDTVGFEDAAQPASGEVFFYLHRGYLGAALGDGSWGQGAFGERTPSSGVCATM